MLSHTVNALARSTSDRFELAVDRVRGLTWLEARDLVRFARLRVGEERLPQVAGSLTFTTMLALVPLLTIALAVLTTFPVFSNVQVALQAYFQQILLPRAISDTIIANLTQFARQATGLSALGALALVLTSVAMMGMIERVFNRIWKVRSARPLVQRITIYWALVTLGPLMFGLSMTATSQLFSATGTVAQTAPFLSSLFYTGVSVGITTAAYTLLYMCVPNRHVDWRDAAWGALVAALAFEVAKRLFGLFVRQFPTYAIIYGALAALPVFLVWIYLSWMITLVGALLTAALPVIKYERWRQQPTPGMEFVDAMAILKVLHDAARLQDSVMVSSSAIRACTRIGYDEMGALLERMVAAGWVGRVQADANAGGRWGRRLRQGLDNWVLLINPSRLSVAEVYRLFVFGAAELPDQAPALEGSVALDTRRLARQVEAAVEQGLSDSLAEHFAAQAEVIEVDASVQSSKAATTASGCSAII